MANGSWNDRDDETATPTLGATRRDRLAAGLRGLAGTAPFVGPIISEVIGQIIPEQRQERLEAYVQNLDVRLSHLEKDDLDDRLRRAVKIDIFEDGAFQAARALTDERISYIAEVVAAGISGEEKEEAESKRLIRLLAELEDDQLIRLASYLHKHRRDSTFRDQHPAVFEPASAALGSSREELDHATLKEAAVNQLLRLGLLRPRFKKAGKGEIPDFDEKTGMMKAQSYELSPLGRMLLRYVGLAEPDDM